MTKDLMKGVIDMHVHTVPICACARMMILNLWKLPSGWGRVPL